VGRQELVHAVRAHPLFRAVRPDKLALAALDATLAVTEDPARACRELPVLAMMTEPAAAVRERAEALAAALRQGLPAGKGVQVEVQASVGRLGSGALPEHDVPSFAVVLDLADPEELQARLRLRSPPIFVRVHEGRLWLDLRTVPEPEDQQAILAALTS
jgi:L-seryl-tRNA(Ser) seleniumtransferase